MERQQIAKAASQTDEAESNLRRLGEEYAAYKAQQQERAEHLQQTLEKMEAKCRKLADKYVAQGLTTVIV